MSDGKTSVRVAREQFAFSIKRRLAVATVLAIYIGLQYLGVYENYNSRIGNEPSPIVQEALNSIWAGGWSLLLILCIQTVSLILLHALLVIFYSWCWRAVISRFREVDRALVFWFGFLAFLTVLAVVNYLLYPGSSAFRNIDLLLVQDGALVALVAVALLPVFILLFGVFRFVLQFPIISLCLCSVLGVDAGYGPPVAQRHVLPPVLLESGSSSPNVILLGVDSLRADVLLRDDRDEVVPNIAQAVSAAASYPDTVTPLARTYPAWVSILTGRAPLRSGARENLYPESSMQLESSLPSLLRSKSGYETSMLYDEQRFANFGVEFGFEHVVGPPQGLRDFLLGSVVDSVASNIFLLLPASRHIFPDQYANRAATAAYKGYRFSSEIGRHLRGLDFDRPQFVAIHFCAAHWPYMPTSLTLNGTRWEYASASAAGYYGSLATADEQYAAAIRDLKEVGLLENAIVVTLSDHGESIGQVGDDEVLSGRGVAPTFPAMGHGMYAYSVAQNQVVLAWQVYRDGVPAVLAGERAQSASLVDIAPTILDSVGMDFDAGYFDGLSLHRSLLSRSDQVERDRFVESAFAPTAFVQGDIQESSVLQEMGNNFEVRPDLRIRLREVAVPRLLASKQRAIWRGHRVLATRFGDDGSPEFVYLPDYRERRGVAFLPNEVRHWEETGDLIVALCEYYRREVRWMRQHCSDIHLSRNESFAVTRNLSPDREEVR